MARADFHMIKQQHVQTQESPHPEKSSHGSAKGLRRGVEECWGAGALHAQRHLRSCRGWQSEPQPHPPTSQAAANKLADWRRARMVRASSCAREITRLSGAGYALKSHEVCSTYWEVPRPHLRETHLGEKFHSEKLADGHVLTRAKTTACDDSRTGRGILPASNEPLGQTHYDHVLSRLFCQQQSLFMLHAPMICNSEALCIIHHHFGSWPSCLKAALFRDACLASAGNSMGCAPGFFFKR